MDNVYVEQYVWNYRGQMMQEIEKMIEEYSQVTFPVEFFVSKHKSIVLIPTGKDSPSQILVISYNEDFSDYKFYSFCDNISNNELVFIYKNINEFKDYLNYQIRSFEKWSTDS